MAFEEWFNIAFPACKEIVNTDHMMPFIQKKSA